MVSWANFPLCHMKPECPHNIRTKVMEQGEVIHAKQANGFELGWRDRMGWLSSGGKNNII